MGQVLAGMLRSKAPWPLRMSALVRSYAGFGRSRLVSWEIGRREFCRAIFCFTNMHYNGNYGAI